MSSSSPIPVNGLPSAPSLAPTSTDPPRQQPPCAGASASFDIEDLVNDSDVSSGDSDDDIDGAKPKTQDPSQQLYPTVPFYGPCIIRGLKPGEKKRWCTCGLSKTQPWCDNAHRGTPFKPLVWKVPDKPQTIYSICNCKYTKSPPFCDAEHTNCPIDIYRRQKACQSVHTESIKICTDCGWTPDTVLIDL